MDPKIAIMTKSREGMGIGEYIYSLYRHVKKITNSTVFYYDFPGIDLGFEPTVEGVKTFHLPYPLPIKNRILGRGWYRIFGIPGKNIPRDFQVFHYSDPSFYSYFPKRIGNSKTVVSCHDLFGFYKNVDMPFSSRKVFQAACKRMKHADKIICGSKNVARELQIFTKVRKEQLEVIHYGVDKKRYYTLNKTKVRKELNLPQDKFIILHVGTEGLHKNVKLILESLKILLKERKDIVFLRVGIKRDFITQFIKDNDIQDHVIRTGEVSREDLVKYYNSADLFVFPSSFENGCLPPIEAMACGIPVIGSTGPSIPEVIGDAGLISEIDAEKLADKIRLVIEDNGLRKKLSRKSLQRSKFFDWDETAKKIKNVYQNL